MNYYEFSKWSIQICKNQKEKESKSCTGVPEVSTNKTRTNRSFTALFIRVTVYSLNPLEKILFMRVILLLLPPDGGAEERSARGSGRLWASTTVVEWRAGPGVPHAHAGLHKLAGGGPGWPGRAHRRPRRPRHRRPREQAAKESREGAHEAK